MTNTPASRLYTPAGFFLLRAPIMPVQTFTGLLSGDGGADGARERLRSLSEHPRFVQALHVASPSMTAGLAHLSGADEKRVARRPGRPHARRSHRTDQARRPRTRHPARRRRHG
ncbi:hypothetical protein ACWCSH_41830, partial [Streptosporangium sp. NPDC001682]